MLPPPSLQNQSTSEAESSAGGSANSSGSASGRAGNRDTVNGSRNDGNGGGNGDIDRTHSTPPASLQPSIHSSVSTSGTGSFSGSNRSYGSSSSRPPAIDTRSRYPGFDFVFSTDAYHYRETVHGTEPGDLISYLKPSYEGQTIESSLPLRLPYFFTGFEWTDFDGKTCTMSRNGVCDAWQVAFNRLIYYASFLDEKTVKFEARDVEFFKKEFAAWNDLFCELDQTLGRLAQCEKAHVLTRFQPSLALNALSNPKNVTNAQTPFNHLSSTFLCAAREILEKHMRELEEPFENVRLIEENVQGWEPCTGYPVIQATQWGGSRNENGDENGMRGDVMRPESIVEGEEVTGTFG